MENAQGPGSARGELENRPEVMEQDFTIITLENFLIAVNFWLLMTCLKFAADHFGSPTALAGFATSIFIVGAIAGGLRAASGSIASGR